MINLLMVKVRSPTDDHLLKFVGLEKLSGNIGLGYLSKRYPQFQSMSTISAALDGFFVDTEKLHLHPYIGAARDYDSLFKIYYIFTDLLLQKAATGPCSRLPG